MSYSQFRTVGSVAQQFDLRVLNGSIIRNVHNQVRPNEAFRQRLNFILSEDLHKPSEAARCETLIYPILLEVWQPYSPTLKLWSHTPIEYDMLLSGVPDYLIAAQSKFGVAVVGAPLVVAVEAKQDDFNLGWGQCGAEMVALTRLNAAHNVQSSDISVFGIVTNGEIWQFAKLEGNVLTQEIRYYGIADLDALFGALTFVMEECKQHVLASQIAIKT
jgi:hypothetical protein